MYKVTPLTQLTDHVNMHTHTQMYNVVGGSCERHPIRPVDHSTSVTPDGASERRSLPGGHKAPAQVFYGRPDWHLDRTAWPGFPGPPPLPVQAACHWCMFGHSSVACYLSPEGPEKWQNQIVWKQKTISIECVNFHSICPEYKFSVWHLQVTI